jgi:para-nitrobenzyl esterase
MLYPVGSAAVTKTARDLMRYTAFRWHTWIYARLQSKAGKSKDFYYYFDQHPSRSPGSLEEDHGSPHGLDVAYVFQHLGQLKPPATTAD